MVPGLSKDHFLRLCALLEWFHAPLGSGLNHALASFSLLQYWYYVTSL